MNIHSEHKPLIIGFGIVALGFIVSGTYTLIRMNDLSAQIDDISAHILSLNDQFSSTTSGLQIAIDETHESLSSALSTERENVGNIKRQLGGFEDQVDDLSGTLGTLQKLSQTDPELLIKYSKVYFLNENYVPVRLSEIPQEYQYSNTKQLLIHSDVLSHLTRMIEAASSTGVKLYTYSAYRSFAEQRALKGNYTVAYGAGTANTFSADQGYSEHQLGTTVDMITSGIGGVLEGFDKTTAYTWMVKNAHKYGFILSYPQNNGYYVYEPWHWRYVGVKLATYLNKQGKTFYDLDQRKIDEYLVSIFD